MGDVIRFPQERCSLDTDLRAEPALVLVLPVVRIDREPGALYHGRSRRRRQFADRPAGEPIGGLMSVYDPIMSPETYEKVGASFEALWSALNWPG